MAAGFLVNTEHSHICQMASHRYPAFSTKISATIRKLLPYHVSTQYRHCTPIPNMSKLKHNSSLAQPPRYEEHEDIELGDYLHAPMEVHLHTTGNTMSSDGGYQDYHPNAPHDPAHQLDCHDQLKQQKKYMSRKVRVYVLHLGGLYAAVVLLIVVLATCIGILVTRRGVSVHTEVNIGSSGTSPTVTTGASLTPSSGLAGTITQHVSPSLLTLTRTRERTMSASAPEPTVTTTIPYTVTIPQTAAETSTKLAAPNDSSDTGEKTLDQDLGMTVITVTPPGSTVTRVTLSTTTLPAALTLPPVTSTMLIIKSKPEPAASSRAPTS
jgi:hypothetical protein